MSNGIVLKRVIAIGPEVPITEITFARGANVITGASNTGKSYILHCIDYLLGAKQIKRITEADRYSTLFLELETAGQPYTIERSLFDGRIRLHSVGFDSRTPESGVEVRSTHAEDDSISAFLLRNAGFDEAVRLRKNARNVTVQLSFRLLAQFFVIPEDRIISEVSPAIAGSQEETRQHSAFEFLLTGRDQGDLEEIPDPKLRKTSLTAKLEVVTDMITALSESVARAETTRQSALDEIATIDEDLRISSAALAETSSRLRVLQQERQDLWKDAKATESRMLVLQQLRRRFALLQNAYESDLARLAFVAEADDLFQQLQTVACPLCGTNLAHHELVTACGRTAETSLSDIRAACDAESAKIRSLAQDLASTIAALDAESEDRAQRSRSLQAQLEEVERELNSSLAPVAALEEARTAQLLDRRRALDAVLSEYDRIEELRSLQSQLDKALREPQRKRDPGPDVGAELHAFAKEVEQLLREWHWASADSRVAFDRTAWDLEIDGRSRKSNGKGVRALLHAAFTLGLLRHCRRKGLPHPGFVVLDSPLTAYKEPKGGTSPEEIHDAFFRSVSTTFKDDQVIILENKEPSADVRPFLHYIDFAGDARFGRAGFFAAIAQDSGENTDTQNEDT